MKGFSIPNVSIPNISIPNLSIGSGISAGTIKSSITSSLPDLKNLVGDLNIENVASEMLSNALSDGIDLPSQLNDLLK